ncbi:MAG TPA: c-type cytochrome [Candidatus Acidoferrales bacterium]|jgi:mono/diheme cytochrome c family protein|nr:c-type cytochrome [Candidatus Acidoferrales bacterium]
MKLALVCAFVCASLLLPFRCPSQEPAKPAEEKPAADAKPPSDAPKQASPSNPTKASPTSLSSGKKKYGQDCAMCHGKEGAGDGDLAEDMKLKLKDLRNADALKDLNDGDMYNLINNGKGKMMGEEGRLKPDEIWDVVNFVRSLSKK